MLTMLYYNIGLLTRCQVTTLKSVYLILTEWPNIISLSFVHILFTNAKAIANYELTTS